MARQKSGFVNLSPILLGYDEERDSVLERRFSAGVIAVLVIV